MPVALGDGNDQLLSDVAREVEVDVGHRLQLPVDEPAQRQVGGHGIHVREAGQVTDDRADRAASAATRRQGMTRRVAAAHLACDLLGQLEHLPVQEEEAGEAEVADQRQLFVESSPRLALVAVGAAVPRCERVVADSGQLRDGRLVAIGEIRVAVAELFGEIELEALCELGGARDRVEIVREAFGGGLRREQDGLVVSAPLALGAFERRAVLDRHHRVLEQRALRVMRVDVARGDRLHADRFRQVAQPHVSLRVAALVGPLQLDEEPVSPEHRGQLGGAVRIAGAEPVPRAARKADQAVVELREQVPVEARREQLGFFGTGARMCCCEQPAQVRVALRRLDEERHVRPVGERHLRAGDRPHAEGLRRVCELERAVDPVVVGERERFVPQLGGARGQFLRMRSAVEERIRRMAVQLDVAHSSPTWSRSSPGLARVS